MHTLYKKLTRVLISFLVAASGLILTGSPVSAAPVSIDLCVLPGTVTMPDTVVVPIWGFGIPSTPGDCSTATASVPGPVLDVNEGDTITINLINGLVGHTLAFEIPGIVLNPGPTDGSSAITFTAGAPGTYLYQSGGGAGRQEAMGLYGALIVRSLSDGQAYDDPNTQYDVEAPLVLSQIDPNFNANPDTFNMYQYLATYWLINGKPYTNTAPTIAAAAGQRVLLRYVNAGYDNTSMMLLGTHEHVFARDASLLNNPFDADAETIPAGATEDVIVTVPSTAPPSVNGFPIFNRQLQTGMMTFIVPTP